MQHEKLPVEKYIQIWSISFLSQVILCTSLATWLICHVAMGQLAPAPKALLAKGPFLPYCGQATKGGWGQPQSYSKTWLGG